MVSPSKLTGPTLPPNATPMEVDGASGKTAAPKGTTVAPPPAPKTKEPKKLVTPDMIVDLINSLNKVGDKLDTVYGALDKQAQKRKSASGPSSAPPPKRESRCIFCTALHMATECTQYPTSGQRWLRIGVLGLCRHCGREGHHPNVCHKKHRKCLECQGDHLTALCPQESTQG